MKPHFCFFLFLSVGLGLWPQVAKAEEGLYAFEVEEFTKKTWEWQGDASFYANHYHHRTDSVLYPRKAGEDQPDREEWLELRINLQSRWDWGNSRLFLVGEALVERSEREERRATEVTLQEGYWQWGAQARGRLELGKRLLRWGKGYLFNPVALMEPPKDPEDPEDSREGYWLAQGAWLFGPNALFDDASIHLVYLPINSDLNPSLADDQAEDARWAAKLYALKGNLDLGLYGAVWEREGQTQIGLDFAGNLTPSLEVHGEKLVSQGDSPSSAASMLGLRYLTEEELTLIFEAYHDTAGLAPKELAQVFSSLEQSTDQAPADWSVLKESQWIGQRYAYLNLSFKEPFDWLYFTPSLAWLQNLDDHSGNLTLQFKYLPTENLLYQLQYHLRHGDSATQFGESLFRDGVELKARYAF